jgi:hypothetical protein
MEGDQKTHQGIDQRVDGRQASAQHRQEDVGRGQQEQAKLDVREHLAPRTAPALAHRHARRHLDGQGARQQRSDQGARVVRAGLAQVREPPLPQQRHHAEDQGRAPQRAEGPRGSRRPPARRASASSWVSPQLEDHLARPSPIQGRRGPRFRRRASQSARPRLRAAGVRSRPAGARFLLP